MAAFRDLETEMQLVDNTGSLLEEVRNSLRIARTLALHNNLDVGRYDTLLSAVGSSLDSLRAISIDLADEHQQIQEDMSE